MITPVGWKKIKVSESFDSITFNRKKIKKGSYLKEGDFPVVDQGEELIGGYTNDVSKVLEIEKPLLGFGDHTRRFKFLDFDFVPGADGLKVLKPKDFFHPKLLYYFLQIVDFPNKGYSRHFKYLKDADVNVPPMGTQEEIAEKLDEVFSILSKQEEQIDSLIRNIELYIKSLLNKAITGELTDKNRDGTFPETWVWRLLPELGELGRGKSKHRPRNDPKLYGGNYPFIQTGDIRNSNTFIKDYTNTYNEIGLSQSKLWKKGTLCITIAANIADTAILDFDACFPDSVVGFTPNGKLCDVRYIEYFLRTAKENLERFAPATAQKNINLKILSVLKVPTPPIDEQKEIVQILDEQISTCDKIKKELIANLTKIKTLKSATLAYSFSGKLVKGASL